MATKKIKTIKAKTKIKTKKIKPATKTVKPVNFYAELVDKMILKITFAKAHNISLGEVLGYGQGIRGVDGEVIRTTHSEPANFTTKNKYTGQNCSKLRLTVALFDYTSGWFGTFKQWHDAGCIVSKGQHGTTIKKYIPLTPEQELENKMALAAKKPLPHHEAWTYWKVFNINQVVALNTESAATLDNLKNLNVSKVDHSISVVKPLAGTDAYGNSWFRIEELDNIKLDNVKIKTGGTLVDGNWCASYVPASHTIKIPQMINCFKSSSHYYSTLLHELAHSTANALGRTLSTDPDKYATEELIAELSAWLLCIEFGLFPANEYNASAYLDHWLNNLQQDANFLKTIMDQVDKIVKKIIKAVRG